jgi:hypothetical protein
MITRMSHMTWKMTASATDTTLPTVCLDGFFIFTFFMLFLPFFPGLFSGDHADDRKNP